MYSGALSRALRFARVDAFDISEEALEVARENAESLRAKVNFFCQDALDLKKPDTPEYDIIVANPPYVLSSEASDMDRRVLDHEPHSALFVPDDDPLLFYKSIARYASAALKEGGRLFFEINPQEADALRALLEKEGFEVDFHRDYVGKVRFVECERRS